MYARILVALDGSKFAEQVLPHVEVLAEKFGSLVTLLQAMTPDHSLIARPPATLGTHQARIAPTTIAAAKRQEIASYLKTVGQRFERRGLDVQYDVREGTAGWVIVEHARDLRADLIAMTTHGEGGLGRLVFGSVADEVLRNAPCPILLIRGSQDHERNE